jgi:hypothetical protein
MHGETEKLRPRRLSPRMDSRPRRYIQAAEPVYQVQPPRPMCAGCEPRSAVLRREEGTREDSLGL